MSVLLESGAVRDLDDSFPISPLPVSRCCPRFFSPFSGRSYPYLEAAGIPSSVTYEPLASSLRDDVCSAFVYSFHYRCSSLRSLRAPIYFLSFLRLGLRG